MVIRRFSTTFGDTVVDKKIFVVYGYHLNEKFAIEIGENLAKEYLSNVIVKMYEGKRLEPYTLDSKRDWSLRSFLRKNLPFDYAIILHDCGPGMDEVMELVEEKLNPPGLFFIYFRKGEIPYDLKAKLTTYCREKRKPEHPALCPFFHENFRDMSKKYDKYRPHSLA
ncbi:MAG: hypothetical protein QMD36_06720 [Candidatus Aenigmarchaeota archaeon]|nr:hypothetical protein [Candidatus Aenigmarchaeota archaeon]